MPLLVALLIELHLPHLPHLLHLLHLMQLHLMKLPSWLDWRYLLRMQILLVLLALVLLELPRRFIRIRPKTARVCLLAIPLPLLLLPAQLLASLGQRGKVGNGRLEQFNMLFDFLLVGCVKWYKRRALPPVGVGPFRHGPPL